MVSRRLQELNESDETESKESIDTNTYIDNEAPYGKNQGNYAKYILETTTEDNKQLYSLN